MQSDLYFVGGRCDVAQAIVSELGRKLSWLFDGTHPFIADGFQNLAFDELRDYEICEL